MIIIDVSDIKNWSGEKLAAAISNLYLINPDNHGAIITESGRRFSESYRRLHEAENSNNTEQNDEIPS